MTHLPPAAPAHTIATLDRTRTAMKFSLWAWACYWPAMGVMLVLGGMRDPVSVAVVALSTLAFVVLIRSGALRATSSRTMKEFLVERPIYLVAALVVFLVLGATVPVFANLGLGLFSGIFLASLVLVGVRLAAYVDATREGVFRTRADQVFLLLLIVAPCTAIVFVDALGGSGVLGDNMQGIAAVNWIGLALLVSVQSEARTYFFLVRLAAFLLFLGAILHKNLKR
ncbi:MAG: hypothetical protein ABR562_08375 [Thermoplasmatota archaeon]